MAANALDRLVALVGFMGAGKSTLAPLVAERIGRRAVDVDDELGVDIPTLFAQGEAAFRAVEERRTCELLASAEPVVLALGGGAITSDAIRRLITEAGREPVERDTLYHHVDRDGNRWKTGAAISVLGAT